MIDAAPPPSRSHPFPITFRARRGAVPSLPCPFCPPTVTRVVPFGRQKGARKLPLGNQKGRPRPRQGGGGETPFATFAVTFASVSAAKRDPQHDLRVPCRSLSGPFHIPFTLTFWPYRRRASEVNLVNSPNIRCINEKS